MQKTKIKQKKKKVIQPDEFILDKFTDVNLYQWNKLNDLLTEYNIKLFYHLESQRALDYAHLVSALRETNSINLKENSWWRIVDYKYSDAPLSSKGSIINGGRFNIGRNLSKYGFNEFPALYLAETEAVAHCEKFGSAKIANGLPDYQLALRKPGSYTVAQLKFELENIFDLTKASNLFGFTKIIAKFTVNDEIKEIAKKLNNYNHLLITKPSQLKQMLLEDNWHHNPVQYDIPSNSQIFARMVKEAGFDGIYYVSTKQKKNKCLALFPDKLEENSGYVELVGATPNSVIHTKLNSTNWKDLI